MASTPQATGDSVRQSPDERASEVESRMTDDERFSLIYSLMPVIFTPAGGVREKRVPDDVPQIAGWVSGVKRLGIPDLKITDSGLGITNPFGGRKGDTATALPAGLTLGATFDPALARVSGALVGREARGKGFNVLCGGAMNLTRDPRHGRNFEYLSEDPWLSGVMAAETVIGAQAQGVISMLKHFVLNSHETNKLWLDAVIDAAALRESDLLAFEIAIERCEPGAIMGAYNKVNGDYCCGSVPLLNDTLKGTFAFKGFVMSDWRAVYSWDFALKGLDQQSGAQLDEKEWFVEPLRAAYAEGKLPRERLSDMVRRVLRSIFAVGLDRPTDLPPIDMAAHRETALAVAREGIVLLQNNRALPLGAEAKRIAVIGGHADKGVLAGGGSSQVTPPGGPAVVVPLGGEGPLALARTEVYFPSSPLAELKKLMPKAQIAYDPGMYVADAVALARRSDVVIVFATKFETEGYDSPDLTLPFGQDALIDAVATANPRTIVVLETGNPISMPWRGKVAGILQAWYPGEAGGQAIAEIISGKISPSGRLPITFPTGVEQLPRPAMPGFGTPLGTPLTIAYNEGAEVGYRWVAQTGAKPLYAFGYGLSYTSFRYDDFAATGGETISATFKVTNVGARDGADVPQLYLTDAAGQRRKRLLGFERVELRPGESRRVELTADPRLLARFNASDNRWHIFEGTYRVALARSAEDVVLTTDARLLAQSFALRARSAQPRATAQSAAADHEFVDHKQVIY